MAKRPATAKPLSKIEVGIRLVMTRKALYLKQSEMAKRAGMSPQALNNYESGRNMIPLMRGVRYCIAVGCTLEWIYRGEMRGLPHELAVTLQQLGREV